MGKFNTTVRDAQGTQIVPIAPERFDLQAYADYEAGLLERNREFAKANEGLLIYRRFRANGVFYDQCRNKEDSLALQLGALQKSMGYAADVANFLEPWYGIGYIAASFGAEYIWKPGQSPEVKPPFSCCEEILNADFKAIADTAIGLETLNRIEYFLEKTKGLLPLSFADVQSPLNMLTYLVPADSLFIDVIEEPETVAAAAERVTGLLIDFLKEQERRIGDRLASPGHGFASSRAFSGVGLSDDVSVMLSAQDYSELFQPSDERIGAAFGGVVYHSCGNWARKIDMVQSIRGIKAADGAFSEETDPMPNAPAEFADRFAGSGIVLNARAVGNADTAFDVFRSLWRKGQKLIAVSYCETPEEQADLYRRLHEYARAFSET